MTGWDLETLPCNYNRQKLGELVRKQPYIEVKDFPVGNGSTTMHLYVRVKKAARQGGQTGAG